MQAQTMMDAALALGARKAAVVSVQGIVFEQRYRALCESNACGNYGKNWTCPPFAGEIAHLIAQAKSYEKALVYQSVFPLADSYDFEGMITGGQQHNHLAQALTLRLIGLPLASRLHLGAGGCHVCDACAKRTEEPCRHPGRAMSSLEAYGVAVSELAALCDMPYMHGPNTVTYFGAYFFSEK